ncbi:MAG TPA: hypothetical protein VIS57_00115, partial [Xanthomonadales bacterium]
MKFKFTLYCLPALLLLATHVTAEPTHAEGRTEYRAPKASVAPVIDGVADDEAWQQARWQDLNQTWLGPEYTDEDFQG